jgi:hypothetical protein
VAYERLLTMPVPGRDKPFYSFDFGPIHFLQYSTEHDFAPGGCCRAAAAAAAARVPRAGLRAACAAV